MSFSIKSVFKGSLIYTLGQVLTKAMGFFLIPLYTAYMTPEAYGICGYVEVFGQLFSVVLMFGFYGAQTRYFYEYKDEPQKIGCFLYSINIYLISVLLFLCTAFTIWGESLYRLFASNEILFYPYFPIIIWSAFFQILVQMVISYYLASKDYLKCASVQFFLAFLLAVSAVYFVAYLNMGAEGKLLARLAANALALLLFYPSYVKKFNFQFSRKMVRYALAFGVPIVFHLLAGTLHAVADRWILERYVSLGQLGLYTLGYQLALLLDVLIQSINKAWQPNYYELMSSNMSFKQKSWENRRFLALWVLTLGSIAMAGMLWSKELLILFASKSYHQAYTVIPYIVLGYALGSFYFLAVSSLFFYKKTKILPLCTIASAVFNIGLNFLWIPKYGIYGAASATLVSMCFQTVVVYSVGIKYFNPGYNIKRLLVCCAFLVIPLTDMTMFSGLALQGVKLGLFFGFIITTWFLFREYYSGLFSKIQVYLRLKKGYCSGR
jgi:O-antigen/teichoic acid export membrane protein